MSNPKTWQPLLAQGPQKTLAVLLVLVALGVGSTKMYATAIPLGGGGVLQIRNLTGTLVGVSSPCINWNTVASACTNPPPAEQDVVNGQDPAVFTVGSTPLDTIKNLPNGVATPLIDFKTVVSPLAGGVVHFDLINIVIPAIPANNNCFTFALNAICTLAGPPLFQGAPLNIFLMTQDTANQVSLFFSTNDEAYTGTSGIGYDAATPYTGNFSAQFSGLLPNGQTATIPNVVFFLFGGGTLTSVNWHITESPVSQSATPEPMSNVLLGSGLLILLVWGSSKSAFAALKGLKDR